MANMLIMMLIDVRHEVHFQNFYYMCTLIDVVCFATSLKPIAFAFLEILTLKKVKMELVEELEGA